jgi:hypothetical protein
VSLKNLVQAVLLLVSGGFAFDLKNTGIDLESFPFWGNLSALLAGLGVTVGLTQERFVQLVTFGRAVAKKWNESDLPNGCTARMNGIVAALRLGVAPGSLKPIFEAEWEVIVRECVPAVPLSRPHA